MSITIDNPGILAIIVDGGRFGQHHIGLTTGGPMDRDAFRIANALVGNQENAAAIEFMLGGVSFTANQAISIAVTGADCKITIDGEAKHRYKHLQVAKGNKVDIAMASSGCRGYIAISGGITVEPAFGSRTTVTREKIGGLNGAKLSAGDLISTGDSPVFKSREIDEADLPLISTEITLRVLIGYQHAQFSPASKRRFFDSEYTVSQRFDRMGCRVEGPSVAAEINGMLSEGITLGAIQVPADGQPIILLADRQTIGGYPKIGSVLSLDLNKLGQAMPGATVRFEEIDQSQAHNELHLANYRMNRLLEKLDD